MRVYIENLTKEYEGRTVLDIKELTIETGVFYGIIGPNGAGKSTLLNLIAGLMTPTKGTLCYADHHTSVPLREITMVFQKPYLMRTSVEKNISYPLKLRGWSKAMMEKRVHELSDELGLTEFCKQKSWKLSGGESQKVALARALSFNPKLLLLDEPTANVDPATTADIEKMLKKFNRNENTTTIIVTHNLAQARRLCDQILFMDQGKVVEYGPGEQLLKSPKQETTRKFVKGELLT